MCLRKYGYYETNENGTRRLAKICREMGVERFIHLSALGATTEPKKGHFVSKSEFLHSKVSLI